MTPTTPPTDTQEGKNNLEKFRQHGTVGNIMALYSEVRDELGDIILSVTTKKREDILSGFWAGEENLSIFDGFWGGDDINEVLDGYTGGHE